MNGSICRLCDIECGETARVLSLSDENLLKERLSDLGFTEGTVVECIMKSPLGDPTAFLIRGAVIALRRDNSKHIAVEVMS
ncbi:MAG: ferrous iron transport protein A [Oscillospiraceae bacterium]|nr:ferrous iron transport protein A [Oscillospiraceae bacterium]